MRGRGGGRNPYTLLIRMLVNVTNMEISMTINHNTKNRTTF
jgi:hypothetical protein